MKIKKLSILGFKSFMERLELSFPVGISGVVGPNGCGKSNIVDAIRWCMGEQSPKQLRGRRMEDIIFNGAGDHKPLGMAEVSLVFENGDGSFPPAFSQDPEMSVTRRLYRSGESEYLINNVPCRLKDIQEVFMDTGLGNNTYSVIGQGKIGTILEQKPEETRIMLEEAAGVTKYRKKVAASQRKIELTQTNLQRVEDILAEVQRQMRSLKRQASKARRYKGVCEEIQNLELLLYSNTYEQLKAESGRKERSTDDLARKELAKSTEMSQFHAKIETMNLELEEKDKGLSDLRAAYLHQRDRVHKNEAALESVDGEMRMQEELETRLKEEQEEIITRLSTLKDEKTGLEQEITRTEKASHDLEEESALKEKRLSARRESLKEIKDAFETARSELSEGANREVGLSHDSNHLNKLIDQISDSRSRLEKELKDVGTKTEDIIKAWERKSLAREAVVHRLGEIEAAIEEQNKACREMEEQRDGVEGDLKSAEAELNACQSRLGSLQTLTENFEGYKMGVRTVMKAKDLAPRQKGRILGLVADVLRVDPRYEQAVEAVLADKLQYVIVASQEDGKEAIDYLKERARGRSSFIPLGDFAGNGMDHKGDGKSPFLRDLVSAPENYASLVNALLGNTMVVEDLDTAISAWRGNGKDRCFVTVEGDIVDERGVVSGGRLSQTSHGLLARKREIAELKEQSIGFQKQVDDLKNKLEKAKAQIRDRNKALEDLTEDKWTGKEELNDFDKILFRLGQELDQCEKLSQRITEDLERQGKEQEGHKKELSRIEGELEKRKARGQREQEYYKKRECELKEAEGEFDQFREELTRLKADYRVIKEEQRSLYREIERIDEYSDASEKRLRKIEEEMSLGRDRVDACRKRKEALREEGHALYEKLKDAEEIVNRADRERQDLQDRIRVEEDKAETLRGEIETLRDEINGAKMAYSEIHYKMNNLVDMVREKANMNLLEIYEQYVDDDFSADDVEEALEHKKRIRQSLGEVNLTAIKEHEALKERHEFIKNQREDLLNSIESLQKAIKKINKTSLEKFLKTLQDVDGKLKEIFPILFGGGAAGLRLTDETQPLESGVLVEVQPPGKKLSHMGLLSGGEKALVAMALLFSLYMIRPSPFCLLDEVDAPLDEANIDRFNKLLREIRRSSQVIMVTHSRRTMEITDRLYGVTMEKAGVSMTVSVDIEGMKKRVSENPPEDQPIAH
ncbi:MAG: chromosome segregation protein SMC [Deltaproteobacteria bacterium]|nr:chromosome segregation protein SMC [Deltaproteobacteria bacterium]